MAFCLVLSSVSASVPFILSQKASAVASSELVYDALPNTSPAVNYPSQAFEATSTSEFGDYIHLGGSNRVLNKVTVTMSNWAKFADYASNPLYNSNSTSWNLPVTLNVYDNQFNASGTPTHKIASITQDQSILWRPASDPDCAPTSNGTGWKVDGTCYDYSGIASNAVFDLSSLHVTLPDDVVVSVTYNTQHHGYNPTGVAGPYNSLNVAVPTSQSVLIGSDKDTDGVVTNSTWIGGYSSLDNHTDGGPTGIFRKSTTWVPYGTVAMKITATPANVAPTVNFAGSTPAADSYVHGIINPRVIATDDYGMGSYYIRLWKNAFESGPANLVVNNCSSAPGAYLLGESKDITCAPIDTNTLPDGKYVLSAQFLDGSGVWGSALRTFYVDNNAPNKPQNLSWTGTNGHVASGGATNSKIGTLSWKAANPSDVDHYVYKFWTNIAGYQDDANNPWSDSYSYVVKTADGGNVPTDFSDKQGTYFFCVEAVDAAGNNSGCSDTYSVTYDTDAPVLAPELSNSPVTVNGSIPDAQATWTHNDVDVDHYEYREYLSLAEANADANGNTASYWIITHPVNEKTQTVGNSWTGEHTLYYRVVAIDAAGNRSVPSALGTVIIDKTGPTVEIQGYTTSLNVITPSVDVTESDVTYSWTQTSGPTTGVTISNPNVAQPSFTVTEDGTYTFELTTTDPAGNKTMKSFIFTYTAPVTPATNTPTIFLPTSVIPVGQTPIAGNGFTNVDVTTNDDTAVLGAQTQKTPVKNDDKNGAKDILGSTATPKNADGTWNIVGLAWYWWLIALAVIGAAWWFIAGYRRRQEQES